jgi:bifunctional oligoribonuclease and PAP phosphatase NrnA
VTDVSKLADLSLLPVPPADLVGRGGAAADEASAQRELERTLAALRGAASERATVVLLAHVKPDGDSLGSAIALGLTLRTLGARAVVSFDADPFVLPRALRFLPGQDLLVEPPLVPTVPDLAVTLDAGSLERLGTLRRIIERARRTVVIDHHPSNTRFGDINHIDTTAASTSMLVVDLIDALGTQLDADIAAAVYAGLITDTGSFRYAATTPAVHLLAARLLSLGIDHAGISRTLWDTHRFAYVRLLGEMQLRARLEPEHDLVWTSCTAAERAAAGIEFDEMEGAIDGIRSTAEAEIAVVCKQDSDGAWIVSVRSKGAVDVGAVCTSLGGGGHRFAAGLTSAGSLEETMSRLRDALDRAPRLAPASAQ